MASKGIPARSFDGDDAQCVSHLRVAIVHTQWNAFVIEPMVEKIKETLLAAGVPNISPVVSVAGSFELCNGASLVLKGCKDVDVVICVGAILKGETSHYDFLSTAVLNTLANLSATNEGAVPIIAGVLTCETKEQAIHRIPSSKEWAETAIQMAILRKRLLKAA